jgi:hypothetical protein
MLARYAKHCSTGKGSFSAPVLQIASNQVCIPPPTFPPNSSST